MDGAERGSGAPAVPLGAPRTERECLEAEVERSPRAGAPWLALIAHVQHAGDVDAMRDVYDRFFEYFPNASAQWIAYTEMELAHSNFAQVDAIFVRCLRTTLSMDLWKLYLQYTRRVNPLPAYTNEENSPREQTQRVLEGAYEFALKYIGWDRESGVIWHDYIQLIREREVRGTWQEGQKMDQLRRVFRRAVVVPMNQVEAIWREYDAYENTLNKITAKKFLGEISPAYMQARSVLRELKSMTDPLARPQLAQLPSWIVPGTRTPAKERQALRAWIRYLEWEQSNPLMLEEQSALIFRVLAAYRKAVMYMRFDAVIWYMAAIYCQLIQRDAEALQWLRNGMDACPWSFLLHFAYADLCRAQGKYQDAITSLDAYVAYLEQAIAQRLHALEQQRQRVDEDVDAERARVRQRREQLDSAPEDETDKTAELVDIERKLQEERVARKDKLEEQARPELDEWKEGMAQAWIKYMQLVRRAEGIRPARQVFARARKAPYATWHVYEANALLEYHCSKEPLVATKVFELALRTFGPEELLVVRYLDFLIAMNDDTNARAVFERTVSSVPPARARPIWERWSEYEYNYGDASAIARLESRLCELYPHESRLDVAVERYRYKTLDFVRNKDLGYTRAVPPVPGEVRTTNEEEAQPEAQPEHAKAEPNAAGRQSMEEIRKSLLAGEPAKKDGEKRGAKSDAAASSKKAKHTEPPRKARQDLVPPLPDALLYFLRILPNARDFDGPLVPPERILECLMHSTLPTVPLAGMSERKGAKRGGQRKAHTGVLRTERLISVEQPTPRWIQMLLGITGETLSFAEYLQVKEHVVYRPGEGNDPAQVGTRFDQTAHIECCGTHTQSRFHGVFSSAARKVEDASYGRFRDNAALGRLGFASVLAALGGGKQAHYEPVLIEK
ncbi:mRNA 3'-end-processing protein rna14 [Malassezia vespertilionis]|uniref:mRNA 3'-end-processing protein rna14 n=1 Tax=Malassezia vespertilionis TaxID=2020962 RepID=UPI0024B25897|nr:mRNA 3'-end-processing protein rna14 [Malassezia vespertilionis]WFD08036.1 mRNA 3'-end-processing protein rna14 [Malassezia vespertilionis]